MYDIERLLDLSDQTPIKDLCEIIAKELNDEIDFLFDELCTEIEMNPDGMLFERIGSFTSMLYKYTSSKPSFATLLNLVSNLSKHITTLRHAAVTAVSFIGSASTPSQRCDLLKALCYKKKTSYIPISGKVSIYSIFKEIDYTEIDQQTRIELMSYLLDLANGETQPICLFNFFTELKRLMVLIDYDQSITVDECELDQLVCDSFCCYFPLVYNPTPEQALKIPRNEMHSLYRSLFFTVTKISQNAIDFLIDILDSSTEQEAPDIYLILAEILQKTNVDLDEISGLIFNVTRALVNPSTKQIRGAVNEMLRVVIAKRDLKKWDEFCESITSIVIREYKFDSGDAGIRQAIGQAYIESCKASQDFALKADSVIFEAINDLKQKVGLVDIIDVHNNSVSAKAVRIMTLSFLLDLFSVIEIPVDCFGAIIEVFSELLIDIAVDKEFEMLTKNLICVARQAPEQYLDSVVAITQQLTAIPDIFAVIRALSLRGKKVDCPQELQIYLETDPEKLGNVPVSCVADIEKLLTFIEAPISSIVVNNARILLNDSEAAINLLTRHRIAQNSQALSMQELQIILFLSGHISAIHCRLSDFIENCKFIDFKKIVEALLLNINNTENDLTDSVTSQIFNLITSETNLSEMSDLVNSNQLRPFEITLLVQGASVEVLANLITLSKRSPSFLPLLSASIEFHGKNFLNLIQAFQEEIVDDLIAGIRSSNSALFCKVLAIIYGCNESLIIRNFNQIIISVEHQIHAENWKISRNIDVIILAELLCVEAEAKEHQRSMSLALGYALESPFFEIRKQARVARQQFLSL